MFLFISCTGRFKGITGRVYFSLRTYFRYVLFNFQEHHSCFSGSFRTNVHASKTILNCLNLKTCRVVEFCFTLISEIIMSVAKCLNMIGC